MVDDMTYDGIAQAFGDSLILHEPTILRMIKFYNRKLKERPDFRGDGVTEYTLANLPADSQRMALIPSSSTVLSTPMLWVPLVVVKNVHILPGIPQLFTKMIDNYFVQHIPAHFRNTSYKRSVIHTNQPESAISQTLREFQERYQSTGIKIGSYPKLMENKASDNPYTKYESSVAVAITSKDSDLLEKVTKELAPLIKSVGVEFVAENEAKSTL
jgi:molybdopterin-biosynthesis enzyme MoeA-like protein